MHENLVLVVDYEKICRLCLHETGAMSEIFENSGETSLLDLILSATGLKIQPGDGLPSKICHKCRYVVELCCELRTMAMRSDAFLIEAAGNQFVTEYIEKPGDENTAPDVSLDTFDRNSDMTRPDLRLVFRDDGLMTLEQCEPEDLTNTEMECTDGDYDSMTEEKKEEKVISRVSTERTRKAAPKHLTCQICLTSYTTTDQVEEHAETHYVHSNLTPYLQLLSPYQCEACNDGAISKKQLILHHRRHLDVNPFICKHPGCKYVGKNKDGLRHHMLKHAARSQVCEACGAAYRRRSELRQHRQRAHSPARPLECRACRPHRVFRNAFTYRAHARTHHAPPQYPCDWRGCPKAYRSRVDLEAHIRAHRGERVYKCHLCAAAAYTSQSLLNRHLRMHERARMSKCDKCSATFTDYGQFYRHRVAEHGPWQPHRCAACNQGYQTESQLQKHLQRCELATAMRSHAQGYDQDVAQQIKHVQLGTDEVLQRQKGPTQVQPGTGGDLGKDSSVLQELPPDGLLYIEVDPETDEENAAGVWRQ